MPFHEIRYGNGHSEIDFFSFVGQKETDRHASHLTVAAKTKDWEYEQEYRLVLGDVPSEAARTMTYDFRALKGIIFGTEMSDCDKMRIKDVVGRKCIVSDDPWFEFNQAYYSPEHGDIRARQILVATFTP